jgi:hypothetical protein
VAYYIGRRLRDQPNGRIVRGATHPDDELVFPGLVLCREKYFSREVAEAEALLHWPDGAARVIEAKNAKQALAVLGEGLPHAPGLFGRVRLMVTPWRSRHRPSGSPRPPGPSDRFDSGSREPRRPSPGGLSASVALRPPDDTLPDNE